MPTVTLKQRLNELIQVLDETHAPEFVASKDYFKVMAMADFVTAKNGEERRFSASTRDKLRSFTRQLYENRSYLKDIIDEQRFFAFVRQTLADLHADGEFAQLPDGKGALKLLSALVSERVTQQIEPFTHHFPAWTLGLETQAPVRIGPVTLATRDHWLEQVDFSDEVKDTFLKTPEANHRWKDLVREALAEPKRATVAGLGQWVYDVICEHRSVLSVEIPGLDVELSTKLAALVCKGALDGISLVYGQPEYFHQQALHTERLGPVRTSSLISTQGRLSRTGHHSGPRVPHLPPAKVREGLTEFASVFAAIGEILQGLVHDKLHSHPKLARRWATALDWYAEGQRESSDAIALSKVATSMDVLAQAGSKGGIRTMVENVTGRKGSDIVIKGVESKTLSAVVKEIYDEGRSEILHGNKVNRMASFAREREMATVLGRILLIETALRLQRYAGPDDEKAFQTMPEVPAT